MGTPEDTISGRMRIREKQADLTNGKDSPFITMDRRVWLGWAEEVGEFEAANARLVEAVKKLPKPPMETRGVKHVPDGVLNRIYDALVPFIKVN